MVKEKQSKTEEVKKPMADNVVRPEKEWPWRLLGSLGILLFIFFWVGVVLTLKNDLINKKIDSLKNEFYDWAATQGFVLDDVVVSGRDKTSKEEINTLLNLKRGDNILKIDVYDIKQKLEQLPWVKHVSVHKRYFPNVLQIEIHEKEVKAIWQINEKFYPLDAEGKIIEAEFHVSEPILLIVGAGAPENFKNLMMALKDEKYDYLDKVKVANFISGRRWNLILNDIREGVTVKLPEENIAAAWKKLLKLNETKGIFKRKLTIIDLRLPNKIVVKIRKSGSDKAPKLNKTVPEHNI
ncbi:MAG: FtsQ-type POTRA domain-containing protein [Alphaproteobacteria bacterium]|nr:FtsQ-type POTRA domain-containing protein [Alphaproteobacteria bacterium]